MTGNGTLKRIDKQLAALEAAAAPEAPKRWPGHASWYFGQFLCTLMHPDFWGDVSGAARRFLWPWWHLVEFHAKFSASAPYDLTDIDAAKEAIHKAASAWLDDPGEPGDGATWNPINGATVHWVKALYRLAVPGAYPACGSREARPVGEFFPGGRRPWDRSFDPDPATWPAGLVERVRASESLTPDPVPAFDWTKIGRSWAGCTGKEIPFPRHADGRPVRGHFRPAAGQVGAPCDTD